MSWLPQRLKGNPEFQSGLVRMAIWVLMIAFLGVAGWLEYYQLDWRLYGALFAVHFLWYLSILISVVRDPRPGPLRRGLGLLGDLSGTTFVILLGGDPQSPFLLFYIWIFVSQAVRYGRPYLIMASVGSLLTFSVLQFALDGWRQYPFEVIFILGILLVLPLYLDNLLRQLYQANQSARAASIRRGRFLAGVVRELRPSVVRVREFAGNLLREEPRESQYQALAAISREAGQLDTTLGDLLDLALMDARELQLKRERFDAGAMMEQLCRELSDQALDHGIELICDLAPDLPNRVHGDAVRLRQLLDQLIRGTLATLESGSLVLRVQLMGADEILARRHLQLELIAAGALRGSGSNPLLTPDIASEDPVGLEVARDLVSLMDGIMGQDPVAVGVRYWIRLPLLDGLGRLETDPVPADLRNLRLLVVEADALARVALVRTLEAAGMRVTSSERLDSRLPADVDVAVLGDSVAGQDLPAMVLALRRQLGSEVPVLCLHFRRRTMRPLAAGAAVETKPFRPQSIWRALAALSAQSLRSPAVTHRVLIVEEREEVARMVEECFARAGVDTVLVQDGQTALEVALEYPFNLVLIACQLPDSVGMELCRRYRQQEGAQQRLSWIGMAEPGQADESACLAAGMSGLVGRPPSGAEQERLLARLMPRH